MERGAQGEEKGILTGPVDIKSREIE